MKLARGKSILASNALVAIAGVAAMLALVRLINVDTAKPRHHAGIAHQGQALPPPVERFAFAPADAFEAPLALRPGYAPDGEAEDADPDQPTDETASWSTETVAPPWQTNLRLAPLARPGRPSQATNDDTPRRRRPFSKSLRSRLAEISPGATARLVKRFADAKAPWPPTEITLIGIKDERILELHARGKGGPWALVHRYRVLAASGGLGPKLRQGDRQVPEGLYRISFLNPNSSYHVSLRVNYPNAFDRKMAAKEGRTDLGGDIMIHGKNLSAGCLAMGDEAVEEIFTLAAETGVSSVRVIIAPTDLRTKSAPPPKSGQPEWVPKLYTEIASAMSDFENTSPITTSSTNIASSLMSFFSK